MQALDPLILNPAMNSDIFPFANPYLYTSSTLTHFPMTTSKYHTNPWRQNTQNQRVSWCPWNCYCGLPVDLLHTRYRKMQHDTQLISYRLRGWLSQRRTRACGSSGSAKYWHWMLALYMFMHECMWFHFMAPGIPRVYLSWYHRMCDHALNPQNVNSTLMCTLSHMHGE